MRVTRFVSKQYVFSPNVGSKIPPPNFLHPQILRKGPLHQLRYSRYEIAHQKIRHNYDPYQHTSTLFRKSIPPPPPLPPYPPHSILIPHQIIIIISPNPSMPNPSIPNPSIPTHILRQSPSIHPSIHLIIPLHEKSFNTKLRLARYTEK